MDKTFIVAEAGINANGEMPKALALVDAAVSAGASAIKFQTYWSTFPDFKWVEFTKSEWKDIFEYCDHKGIQWFSTPFDFEAIDFLNEMGMDIWKVPSGMITNIPYLEKIKSIKPKHIILSTGMATFEEHRDAFLIFCGPKVEDREDVFDTLLCTSIYPTPYDEVGLNVFETGFHGEKSCYTGISDHTLGIEVPIAAVALGARVVEKHLTLDCMLPGPDHKASLEPHEFARMVTAIRHIELAMGSGVKKPTPSELKVRDEIRERMGCTARN